MRLAEVPNFSVVAAPVEKGVKPVAVAQNVERVVWARLPPTFSCGLTGFMGSCSLLVIYHSGIYCEAVLFYLLCP
jgi:hypothetical protein